MFHCTLIYRFCASRKSGTPPPPAEPKAAPAPYPSMSASLSANPHPAIFDAGPLGKLTVTGVLSGGGFWQSHPAVDFFGKENASSYGDITNATVIINKTDGKIQFYIQAGA